MKKLISIIFLILYVSMASSLIVQAAPVANVQDNKLILSGTSENNKSVTVAITDNQTGEIVFLDEQISINGKYTFETILPSGEFSARVVAGTSPASSVTINTENKAAVSSTPNVPPAGEQSPVTTSSPSKKTSNSKGASKSQSTSQDTTSSQISQSNDDITTSKESISDETKTPNIDDNDKPKEKNSFVTVLIIVLIIFITAIVAIIIYIINKKRK